MAQAILLRAIPKMPAPIQDFMTTTSQLSAASTETVLDVNVGVTLIHTYDGDLVLTLIGPNGTRIKLADQRGSFGHNFTGTIFDDEATTPISSGSAPFTGSFRPEVPLSGLDGIVAGGTWTLEIQDGFGGDTGTLDAWSITFLTSAPPTCNVCTAAPPLPGEVASLLWSGTSRDTLEWGSTPGASSYRLYRGESADLPLLLDASTDSCERLETAGLSSGAILTEIPAQRTFHWFLVRGANGAGQGPAGNATPGPRSQDSAGVCPQRESGTFWFFPGGPQQRRLPRSKEKTRMSP